MKLIGKFPLVLSVILSSAQFAQAQTCPTYPANLTNGTTADATAVMGNFNSILNCANNNLAPLAALPLRGYLGGLTLSNDGPSPNSVIDVAAGSAASDDATTLMNLTSGYTKSLSSWIVGSGNGGLDTGSAAANTWYHLFVIERPDTAVVDILISTSATSPTLPANYTKKRRIGSIKTDASSHILTFSQFGDEFLWGAVVQDVNNGSVGTTALMPTLTVPSGIKVYAEFYGVILNAGSAVAGLFTSPDSPNNVANSPVGNYNVVGPSSSLSGSTQFNIRTNTSQQIRVVSNLASSNYYVVTIGWIDLRGKIQ